MRFSLVLMRTGKPTPSNYLHRQLDVTDGLVTWRSLSDPWYIVSILLGVPRGIFSNFSSLPPYGSGEQPS
jgi:hypothetical protein